MTDDDFKQLGTGDIVREHSSGMTYLMSQNYGGRVTVVRTVDMTDPEKWSLVMKANLQRPAGEKLEAPPTPVVP